MASRIQDRQGFHSNAGPRIVAWVTVPIVIAAAGVAILGQYDPLAPNVLLAVGAALALGLVLITVSLVAHVLESRDLAQLDALLDRAETSHRDALESSERVRVELGVADTSDSENPRG